MKITTTTPELSLAVENEVVSEQPVDSNNLFLDLLSSLYEEIENSLEEMNGESLADGQTDEDKANSDTTIDMDAGSLEAMLFGLPPLLQQYNQDLADQQQAQNNDAQSDLDNSFPNQNLAQFSIQNQALNTDVVGVESSEDTQEMPLQAANQMDDFKLKSLIDAKVEHANAVTSLADAQPELKFNAVFTQIGNFINSYTLPVQTQKPVESTNDLAPTTHAADYQLEIKTLPTTDALMKDTYSANIKIYPPELGPVLAKIDMKADDANLLIVTQSHAVRHIVESNLHQLQEQFKQADITVNNIKVEVQDPKQQSTHTGQQNQQQKSDNQPQNNLLDDGVSGIATEKTAVKSSNSIIDTFI